MTRPLIVLGGNRNKVLPRAVYYQCIWIMRDRERLLDLVSFFEKNCENFETVLITDITEGPVDELTVSQAKFRLEAIDKAEASIPEEYREGIIGHIVGNERYPDIACENTWKKWNNVFVSSLAKELHLI